MQKDKQGYIKVSPIRLISHIFFDNPQGPGSGEYRVLRGGSWRHIDFRFLCVGYRSQDDPQAPRLRSRFSHVQGALDFGFLPLACEIRERTQYVIDHRKGAKSAKVLFFRK